MCVCVWGGVCKYQPKLNQNQRKTRGVQAEGGRWGERVCVAGEVGRGVLFQSTAAMC